LFLGGCTSALWKQETFARRFQPANPVNLELFYSESRKDILVAYDETTDKDTKVERRQYWLERDNITVNRERKPHFVSARAAEGLKKIPVEEEAPAGTAGKEDLVVVARQDDDFFTLYSGGEKLDPYKLPAYPDPSRRAKQVLLTPLAVTLDATIIGAVMGAYWSPYMLASLNSR
jgi:hypothetical protein